VEQTFIRQEIQNPANFFRKVMYVVSEGGIMKDFKVMDTLEAIALLPDGSIIVPSCL